MAEEARKLAESASMAELKRGYLDLAGHWSKLANEIEKRFPSAYP